MPRPHLVSHLQAALAALLLLAAISPAAASASTAAASVVNGQRAVRGSFPSLAFVYFQTGGEGEACTGTVVASNLVLTAAHCVVDEASGAQRPPAGFRVVTGSVDWQGGERTVTPVAAVAIHPDYAPGGEHPHWADAALLQLARPVAAPPVALAGTEAWGPGSAALIAGWGALGAGQVVPARLRDATTTVQSAAYCGEGASSFDPSGQLCVLDAGGAHAACTGDSGGPLLVTDPASGEPLEIGIASFAVSDSCDPGSPQYYTRADFVAPWVGAEIAALAPVPSTTGAVLPRLGRRLAKGYARAALRRDLGGSFAGASAYSAQCEEVEPSKRACAVSWNGGAFRYGGQVTVYYALESNRVVWRYALRVKRLRTCLKSNGCDWRERGRAGVGRREAE
jgi:secreted trypsin-like serine protease